MTGLRGGRSAAPIRAKSARKAWALNDRPEFWLLAAAVFAGNGLLAAWQRNWWLAVMQLGTAMLAARAAVIASAAHAAPSNTTEEAAEDTEAEPTHALD